MAAGEHVALDVVAMRTSFTPEEIRRMTANDLAALQRDFPPASENSWVDRMSHIIQDLHKLASESEQIQSQSTSWSDAFPPFLPRTSATKE
jgi:hypothetical protein